MGDRLRADLDAEFLVAYDYGTGGLWAVLIAPSVDAIATKYPELHIVRERPRWMDDAEYEKLRGDPLWLDDEPPQGLLRAAVAGRSD